MYSVFGCRLSLRVATVLRCTLGATSCVSAARRILAFFFSARELSSYSPLAIGLVYSEVNHFFSPRNPGATLGRR